MMAAIRDRLQAAPIASAFGARMRVLISAAARSGGKVGLQILQGLAIGLGGGDARPHAHPAADFGEKAPHEPR
jgi:hypothetical protein